MCGPISSLIDAQVLGVIGVDPEAVDVVERRDHGEAGVALAQPEIGADGHRAHFGQRCGERLQGLGDPLDLVGRSVGLEIEGDDMMQHPATVAAAAGTLRHGAQATVATHPAGVVESACACGLRVIPGARSPVTNSPWHLLCSACLRGGRPPAGRTGRSGWQAAYRPTGGRDSRACARSDLEHPTRRAWQPGSCCSARSSSAPASAR